MDDHSIPRYMPMIEGKIEEFQLNFWETVDEPDRQWLTHIALTAIPQAQEKANLGYTQLSSVVPFGQAHLCSKYSRLMGYHKFVDQCTRPPEWGDKWYKPEGHVHRTEWDYSRNTIIKQPPPKDARPLAEILQAQHREAIDRLTRSPCEVRGLGEIKFIYGEGLDARSIWTTKAMLRTFSEHYDTLFDDIGLAERKPESFETDPLTLDVPDLKTKARLLKVKDQHLNIALDYMFDMLHGKPSIYTHLGLEELLAVAVVADFFKSSALWESFIYIVYSRTDLWDLMIPIRLLQMAAVSQQVIQIKKFDHEPEKPSLNKWIRYFFALHPKYHEWIKTNGLRALSVEESLSFYKVAKQYDQKDLMEVVRDHILTLLTSINLQLFSDYALSSSDEALLETLTQAISTNDNLIIAAPEALALYSAAYDQGALNLANAVRQRIQVLVDRDTLHLFLEFAASKNDAKLMQSLCATISTNHRLLFRPELFSAEEMLNVDNILVISAYAAKKRDSKIKDFLKNFMGNNENANQTLLQKMAKQAKGSASGDENSPNNSLVLSVSTDTQSSAQLAAYKQWKELLRDNTF